MKTPYWSVSAAKSFEKCNRQWYFHYVMAHHNAKDKNRKEAYILSKLQGIYAWRGSLVDFVVSQYFLPLLLNPPSIEQLLNKAKTLFEEQWSVGVTHLIRKDGYSKLPKEKKIAFYAMEYGLPISNEEKEKAWKDIEQSLNNLVAMKDVILLCKSAKQIVVQPFLVFEYQKIMVRCIPDVILLFEDKNPTIIDWKVNIFDTSDHRVQLSAYAFALTKCDWKTYFPRFNAVSNPTEIQLLETQLLLGQKREYFLDEADIQDIESMIYRSGTSMLLALRDENSHEEMMPFDFTVTSNPNLCQKCNFRSLCWKEKEKWVEPRQMSFL